MADIMTNRTTDGESDSVQMTGPATLWPKGTFDGAKLIVWVSDDDSNFQIGKQFKEGDNAAYNCEAKGVWYVKAEVADAGDNTDLSLSSTS